MGVDDWIARKEQEEREKKEILKEMFSGEIVRDVPPTRVSSDYIAERLREPVVVPVVRRPPLPQRGADEPSKD